MYQEDFDLERREKERLKEEKENERLRLQAEVTSLQLQLDRCRTELSYYSSETNRLAHQLKIKCQADQEQYTTYLRNKVSTEFKVHRVMVERSINVPCMVSPIVRVMSHDHQMSHSHTLIHLLKRTVQRCIVIALLLDQGHLKGNLCPHLINIVLAEIKTNLLGSQIFHHMISYPIPMMWACTWSFVAEKLLMSQMCQGVCPTDTARRA